MPSILISAFRAGQQRKRAMLMLGLMYAVAFLGIMGLTALIDGGQFARLYLLGGKISEEMVSQADFQMAMWAAMLMYLPLSLLFWHAPALVHWHGVTPVKSVFFSFMACYKNFAAFTVYGLVWSAAFILALLVVGLLGVLLGNPGFAGLAMFPIALIFFAMFFTSVYFTFRDSFEATPADAPADTP
jgi:hypothetical protein